MQRKKNRPLIITADQKYASAVLRRRISDSPFLRQLGLKVDDGAELDEILSVLPIVDKVALGAAGESMYMLPTDSIALFSETTGTTGGKPLLTPRGHGELRWNGFNQALAYKRHLQPGKDRVAILHPVLLSPFAEVSAAALTRLGVGYLRIFPVPEICDYHRIARVLEDYQITAIMTTPTLAYKVLFELTNLGRLPSCVEKLLLTGEILSSASLANLDRIVGRGKGVARAFVYGSSEAATLMYGTNDGTYRAYLNDFLLEILPDDSLRIDGIASFQAHDATIGRLVVTWLRDGVMPLVRYDTGDIFSARFNRQENDWIFEAMGRTDSIITPDMTRNVDQIFYGVNAPIFHYDLRIESSAVIANVFSTENDCISTQQRELKEAVELLFQRKAVIQLNPQNHPFFDFSPRAKSQRIIFSD